MAALNNKNKKDVSLLRGNRVSLKVNNNSNNKSEAITVRKIYYRKKVSLQGKKSFIGKGKTPDSFTTRRNN